MTKDRSRHQDELSSFCEALERFISTLICISNDDAIKHGRGEQESEFYTSNFPSVRVQVVELSLCSKRLNLSGGARKCDLVCGKLPFSFQIDHVPT